MSFFLNLKTNTDKCIDGCTLFNDTSKFSYWENNETTNDEKDVITFLKNDDLFNNKRILHIGIGNSYIAKNLKNFKKIDGISLSKNELDLAKKSNIDNYEVFFQNKYCQNNILSKILNFYDIIIDVNIKSFACCDKAFVNLFKTYSELLNNNGIIITSKSGMKWSRQIKPVLSFSFKKLFYKKLKEFDGPKKNILEIKECLALSKEHNLKYTEDNKSKIAFFKKL